MYLSVIIPAYNEEKRIKATLIDVHDFLSKQDYDYEILVVNDGSKDDTANLVRSLQNQIKNLQLIDNEKNKGKGGVVKQGMIQAKGDHRLFMDADNSTTINQVDTLLTHIDTYDVVIGSRRVKGAFVDVHQSWIKEFMGRLGNLWIRMFAASGIRDSQAGFKLFTADAAEKIFPRLTLTRWGFDFEAIAIARIHKLKVYEAPIIWKNDEGSKVKGSDYIKVLFEAMKVGWNRATGMYN